jgi:hypothetical protein
MRYRFCVVASAYHRGRLRVVYDPSGSSLSPEYNVQYSCIVDLAEKRDFTVEVGWGSPKGFLPMSPIWDDDAYSIVAGTLAGTGQTGNGNITVYVMNDLQSPSTTASNITVQVFVSAGDDIEFACPSTEMLSFLSIFQTQSGETMADKGGGSSPGIDLPDTETDLMAVSSTDVVMAVKPNAMGEALLVYQGEVVPSIRTLIKRFDYWRFLPIEEATERLNVWKMPAYLPYPGWGPVGMDEAENAAVATLPYNFCNMTLMHWAMMAFKGYRGTMRYKALYDNTDFQEMTSFMSASRDNTVSGYSATTEQNPLQSETVGERARFWTRFTKNIGDGAVVTSQRVNPCLEFDIPHYSDKRFFNAKVTTQASTVETDTFNHLVIQATSNTRTTHCSGIHTYWAAGEDFQLGFYVGPPPVYRTVVLPPAIS